MENTYENVVSSTKHKIASEQAIIENNIIIENGENVSKVLAINANVDLDFPIETMNNECTISGKIFTNLIYVSNDGEINNQLTMSPFLHKIINPNIQVNSKMNLKANVVGSEMEKISNGQIKVLTTLNIDGVIVNNNEVEYLKETESNIYIKQQEREIVALKSQECDKFSEKFDITVKNGVKKILMTEVSGILQEWSTGYNFISIEAELYVKMLYIDKQDSLELQTITIAKTIKQEIDAEGIDKNSDIDINMVIINEGVDVVLDEKENGETNVSVNVPLMVCYNTYVQSSLLAITDVYSTKSVLNVEQGYIENDKNCIPEVIEGKIEGNVILNDELRIDKYITTINIIPCISNFYIKDKNIYIEGTVSSNVIYLNDDNESIQSIQIEIPFVINKEVNVECDFIDPNIYVYDIDVMVKRGREIYFDAKVKAFVNVVRKYNNELITKIESVSEIPNRNNAIEIYFAKEGESFWEIGKNLKIPTEMISSQNPELTDPLEKDQNIALYFQKGIN